MLISTPLSSSHALPRLRNRAARRTLHASRVRAPHPWGARVMGPVDAEDVFRSFRYDAHPMVILAYHADANPSLRGQNVSTDGITASLHSWTS
ncbi:hypothetical protein FIBSPDRAFT_856088 [Athelia psychrophila]|uniref:Uncharacterized protein n=1 Tax=Athelia psychrophila TaxID=1759441 RepID=A0A166NLR5_9AGAM|nr:hypothetical protein FIBSPDRAFT_856088 [Fibularhizoctonia sp. CBS 109695]